LTSSKVHLLEQQLAPSGIYKVVRRIDLGTARSEDEVNQIVDSYLKDNLNK